MCNLYSMVRSRDEIARLFRVMVDQTSNQPPQPAIFPDQLAPAIRMGSDGTRVMQAMRWGFPPPPNLGSRPVTNIRSTASPYWRGWLKPQFRCLVPVTSFCKFTDSLPKVPHWFALDASRPPFAFAGIWRSWMGTRGTKAAPDEGEHLLFSFLTTNANALMQPIHAKAMPVVLTTPEDAETWLMAPAEVALQLQHPAPPGLLSIVATGQRQDGAA